MGLSFGGLGTIAGGLLGGGAGAAIGGALGGLFDGGGGGGVSGAYDTASAAQLQAARNAQFRPVGITTNFGRSNFEIDPTTGQLKSAGYSLNPQLQGLQSSLLGGFAPSLAQAQGVDTRNLQNAAQSMYGLGQQLLPTNIARTASPEAMALAQQYQQASQGLMPTSFATQGSPEAQAYAEQLRGLSSQVTPTSYDPIAAAQRYTSQQQDLLAPGREQQLAGVRNRLFQTGRTGLATGGTSAGGLQATNPEMAAYYNSLAQQDKAIAAGAEQQARANLSQDIGLGTQLGANALNAQTTSEQLARQNMLQNLGLSLGFGQQAYTTGASAEDLARSRFAQDIGLGSGLFSSGAGLQGTAFGLQSAAYDPFKTQLGLATQLEALGQQPLGLGSELGGRASTAAANAGQLASGAIQTGLAGQIAQQGLQASRQTSLQNQLTGLFGNSQVQQGLGNVGSQVSGWFNNLISPTPYSDRGTIWGNTAGSYAGFDY